MATSNNSSEALRVGVETTERRHIPSVSELIKALLRGSRRALGQIITIVENDKPGAREIMQTIRPHLGKAMVIGVTGPPGAGKSTLVNALIKQFRRDGKTVGVVAIDPSSPISGGSILGDRLRMDTATGDDGVFVRSLASGGHLGGLSLLTSRVVDALDAASYERIIVETVGAGQSEVEIASLADVKVVVMVPGLGDDIQAIKAGILEIADILVVNKCDLPGAAPTLAQLHAMLGLRSDQGAGVTLVKTSAIQGIGIADLAAALDTFAQGLNKAAKAANRLQRARYILALSAAAKVRQTILQAGTGDSNDNHDEFVDTLARRLDEGTISLDEALAAWFASSIEKQN